MFLRVLYLGFNKLNVIHHFIPFPFPDVLHFVLLLLYVIIMSNVILIYIWHTCCLYSTELQKEVQSLQAIITSLTLQIREKEERNVYLTENIKGIYTTYMALYFTYCRFAVSDIRGERSP